MEPTVSASRFKSRCLALIDEVASSKEPLIITKHGTPFVMLVPLSQPKRSLYGLHKGMGSRFSENLIEPLEEPCAVESNEVL